MEGMFSKTAAERSITEWVETDASIARLLRQINQAFPHEQVLLIGGSLRDKLLEKLPPRDFDLVVDVQAPEILYRRLPKARRNFFGGLTLTIRGYSVDLWALADTFHIKKFKLDPTVENLLAGAPLNLDKIAFDVRQHVLFEDSCLRGLSDRVIEYAPANRYLEQVQAARCVLLQKKTGFSLAESALSLLMRVSRSLRENESAAGQIHNFLRTSHTLSDAARRDVLTDIETGGRAFVRDVGAAEPSSPVLD